VSNLEVIVRLKKELGSSGVAEFGSVGAGQGLSMIQGFMN